MKIKPPFWKQAWGDIAGQLFDLVSGPDQKLDYPCSPAAAALIEERYSSLQWPDSLVQLDQMLAQDWTGDIGARLGDWAAIYQYQILTSMGPGVLSLEGASLQLLKDLARSQGAYLAGVLGRVLRCWELYQVFGDLMLMLRQIPTPLLGEVVRESLTPAYLKAKARVLYGEALMTGDRQGARQAQEILDASEADLQREINRSLEGLSSQELGLHLQRSAMEVAQIFGEIFGSRQWQEQMSQHLPLIFQTMAGYLGYSFASYMASHPEEVAGVLGALKKRGEVEAAVEQYRWLYGWGGDRSAAVKKAWSAVAPKHFRLSSRIEDIQQDEDQQKLIGMASGLADYCLNQPAVTALLDGVSGRLKSYLATAALNEERDRQRHLRTKGNRAITEARHAADFCSEDDGTGGEKALLDDEILSRLKEIFQPQRDSLAEEVEANETLDTWWQSLSEQQRDMVKLADNGYSQEEIAQKMGLSQQRVSQVLVEAEEKFKKLKKSQAAA